MGVREKANYSSQQLVLAAHMADQSIRYNYMHVYKQYIYVYMYMCKFMHVHVYDCMFIRK